MNIKFKGKRIDNGKWVEGDYFKTPLTDENSGYPPESGWFFLTGEPRHCISREGVVFVVDPESVEMISGYFLLRYHLSRRSDEGWNNYRLIIAESVEHAKEILIKKVSRIESDAFNSWEVIPDNIECLNI